MVGDAPSAPASPAAYEARDVPLAVDSGASGLGQALRGLADLQGALLDEEVSAFSAAPRSSEAEAAYADAVFHKACALLEADALKPLIHVARSEREVARRRRDAALAERDRLLALAGGKPVDEGLID